jgi:hypothetical protein
VNNSLLEIAPNNSKSLVLVARKPRGFDVEDAYELTPSAAKMRASIGNNARGN